MKLTHIARATIKAYLEEEKYNVDEDTQNRYKKQGGTFVTLTDKKGNLRGCIGTLPFHEKSELKELWRDVQENAINAAFNDFRFSPIKNEKELEEIKIEVSILSEPKKLHDKNAKFLLNQITKGMGIILKSGKYIATFLPQVWEEISNKEKFLEQLSLKAGLKKDAWKNSEIWYYTVDVEEE